MVQALLKTLSMVTGKQCTINLLALIHRQQVLHGGELMWEMCTTFVSSSSPTAPTAVLKDCQILKSELAFPWMTMAILILYAGEIIR